MIAKMIEIILEFKFLQNAIFASLLSSVVCGIIGVIVIEKKLLMMSGGISHTALGGVGLGYLLDFEPMFGAILFSVLAALGIGTVNRSKKANADIIIAMFWSLGMALGIMFITLRPGYPPNINSYLFGNILSITKAGIQLMLILATVVTLSITIFFQDWKLWLFDVEFAKLSGLKVKMMENIMLILIALTVVVMIRVTGLILVIALLSIPAATSSLITKILRNRIIVAIIFGISICFLGLFFSFVTNIPSGATIIMIGILVYISVFGITIVKKKLHKKS